MATGDLLSDGDIDAMLRELLVDPEGQKGWELRQRTRLSAFIEQSDVPDDAQVPDHSRDRVVMLRHGATTERAGRSRRIVASAAAAVLVAVGAFATVRITTDQHVDEPAATEPSSTEPAPPATSNVWPSLLPTITPLEGETVTASASEIATESPRQTTAVVARVDGTSVTDVVHIAAVDTVPYLAAWGSILEASYDATDVIIDGVTVTGYEVKANLAGGSPMVIVPYDDSHSVVVRGADPLGFLSLAGPSFASISDDPTATDGSLALGLDGLPAGYESLAGPGPLVPGALVPYLTLSRADGPTVATISQGEPNLFPYDSPLIRTDDGRYWWSDPAFGSGSFLMWPIGDGQWISIQNVFGADDDTPATLEETLAIADRIELVDRDTWLARYPDAIDRGAPATTLASEDLEEIPVATMAVPVATVEVPVAP